MKKFISMVMAAAMVVSLVPATAFAANTATAKVVEALEITAEQAETSVSVDYYTSKVPQLQIKLTDVDSLAGKVDTFDLTLKFDKVDVTAASLTTADVKVYRPGDTNATILDSSNGSVAVSVDTDKDTIDVKLTEDAGTPVVDLKAGDVIAIDLGGVLTKTKAGTVGTVAVKGDFGTIDAMPFFSIVEEGIKVELDDDVVDVAPEEVTTLETIVIKPAAGPNFVANADALEEVTLKLSKGFEFVPVTANTDTVSFVGTRLADFDIPASYYDENEVSFLLNAAEQAATELRIVGLQVEATTADAGDVATLTVKYSNLPAQKVEVAKVVDMKVVMELADADEDVPVIYSGVNVNNDGITDDSTHESLEVVIKETFAGAWSNHKDWTLTLPEGVYVTNVVAADETATNTWGGDAQVQADFATAFANGDHEFFEFDKRTFPETHQTGNPHEISFVMTLVAEPGFVGDVTLTLEGAALDTQEVVIAKFVAPYTIKAEANDVIIDYRYTEVPTAIVVTEAEAGLWDDAASTRAAFRFTVERGDMIQFEDEAVYTVNEASEMEIDDTTTFNGTTSSVAFEVEESSDEEAAEVTISGIELFMQRNIPAGPYDLTIGTSMGRWFLAQPLFNADHTGCTTATADTHTGECIVDNVDDVNTTVKEGWVNVVTAGRDQDDASFTTKIVVPVGENYLVAGEKQVTLDVPAYINANGYTMLPVRAVATALGINNEAVQWDQATKTVIIMYGQRIITMTAGQSVVYVSGTAIPAKAAVEIVDGRAFLGLRDLATTLGISAVSYDDATKTATLN